jgi:hypothetical protein
MISEAVETALRAAPSPGLRALVARGDEARLAAELAASVIAGSFDPRSGVLTWPQAGHPPAGLE